MFVAVFGGPPPKGDAAWGGSDEGAGICLQACNAPLVRVLQAAAFASQGIMQYKTIQVLNTLGCVCNLVGWFHSMYICIPTWPDRIEAGSACRVSICDTPTWHDESKPNRVGSALTARHSIPPPCRSAGSSHPRTARPTCTGCRSSSSPTRAPSATSSRWVEGRVGRYRRSSGRLPRRMYRTELARWNNPRASTHAQQTNQTQRTTPHDTTRRVIMYHAPRRTRAQTRRRTITGGCVCTSSRRGAWSWRGTGRGSACCTASRPALHPGAWCLGCCFLGCLVGWAVYGLMD